MSEKRFRAEVDDKGHLKIITDGETVLNDSYELVDLLNEQQATINKQLSQIIELQDKYRILEFNHSRLEKRNKAQYEKIGEQQATISRLEEENEQLRQKLDFYLLDEFEWKEKYSD